MTIASDLVVGANAGRARSHNRQVVLDRVRSAGRIGRAEIARASGLTTQAVSNIIADLLDDGLIVESGRHAAGRGLPAVQYTLNASGGFALGVEVRPDAVFAAILNLCGQTVAAERRDLKSADRACVTSTMLALRDQLLTATSTPDDRLLGAGIVMPGPFGATGIRDSGSELPVWGEGAPQDWFSDALELPVVIENDANAAAIAERILGRAQGLETYAFLYFGNGIGLGVVENGRLVTGAHGNAGEIGHIPVPSGGSLESRVSRLSVQRALGQAGIEATTVADLERLYDTGTPALLAWLDAAVGPLSAAVAIVENLFDPNTIILGGAMPDSLLDHLIAEMPLTDRSVANRGDRALPRVVRGTSGRMTATLGAAALVINHAFTPKITA